MNKFIGMILISVIAGVIVYYLIQLGYLHKPLVKGKELKQQLDNKLSEVTEDNLNLDKVI